MTSRKLRGRYWFCDSRGQKGGGGGGAKSPNLLDVMYECSVIFVVYFDQQMHMQACVCMVETNKKCLKMITNILFSSCVIEAHVRLTYEH